MSEDVNLVFYKTGRIVFVLCPPLNNLMNNLTIMLKQLIYCFFYLMFLSLSSCLIEQGFDEISTNADEWVFPQDGAVLNFTHILFDFETQLNTTEYELQIAMDKNDFNQTLVFSKKINKPTYLVEDTILSFGGTYFWRVNYYEKGKKTHVSYIRKFKIHLPDFLLKTQQEINIKKNLKGQHLGGYIFIDSYGILINRAGKIVWYHPHYITKKKLKRDLNREQFRVLMLQKNGNLLFLSKHERFPVLVQAFNEMYETTIDGEEIWHAPDDGAISGKRLEYYHHDFYKTSYGNYIIMGESRIPKLHPEKGDTIKSRNLTLIEYNSRGNVVWAWESNQEYFKDKQYLEKNIVVDDPTHANALFYDEKNDLIYVSFRNISQILKLKKSTKEVLDTYGKKHQHIGARTGDGIFYYQHAPKIINEDTMIIFNNMFGDPVKTDVNSKITILKLPKTNEDAIEIVWEYELNYHDHIGDIYHAHRKGDVDVLSNGNILAALGSVPYVIELAGDTPVWECQFNKENYRAEWVANLYPCTFSVEIKKTEDNYSLRISNNGWADDTYLINISDQKDKNISTQKINLKAYSNTEIVLNEKEGFEKELFISVESSLNPTKRKILNIRN